MSANTKTNAKGAKIDWAMLADTAEQMRLRAYAPYSGYTVGAAVLATYDDGTSVVFTGSNVENASYGLCVCAERNAVMAAVIAGARSLTAIAVATPGPVAGAPCGMCRQVLAEFADDLPVALVSGGTVVEKTKLSRLLPGAFRPATLAAAGTAKTQTGKRARKNTR